MTITLNKSHLTALLIVVLTGLVLALGVNTYLITHDSSTQSPSSPSTSKYVQKDDWNIDRYKKGQSSNKDCISYDGDRTNDTCDSSKSTGTTSAKPQGDSEAGPEYNSTRTSYFNTYNDQYKNWHHE